VYRAYGACTTLCVVLQLVSSKYIDIIIDLGNNEIEKKNQMSEKLNGCMCALESGRRTGGLRKKKRKPKKEQNPKSEVFYVYLKFERHHLLLLADLDINY
jgi:hypothetical protein